MFRINLDGFYSEHLQEISERLKSQSEMINASLVPAMKQMQKISEQVANINIAALSRTQEFQQLLETIAKEAEEIPDHADKVLAYLAKHGWFIPFNSSSLKIFKKYSYLIDEEKHEVIENKLQEYIRERVPLIKKNVNTHFPNRFRIIEAAFEAHSDKRYMLSIPTLLAQADGMFSDLLDKTFYSNNEKELEDIRKRILLKLAQNGHSTNTSSLGYLLVKQLQEKSIIHENFKEFEKSKNGDYKLEPLNRNYILHGRALDYDNEPNSLRTIALIGLLCDCKDTFTM